MPSRKFWYSHIAQWIFSAPQIVAQIIGSIEDLVLLLWRLLVAARILIGHEIVWFVWLPPSFLSHRSLLSTTLFQSRIHMTGWVCAHNAITYGLHHAIEHFCGGQFDYITNITLNNFQWLFSIVQTKMVVRDNRLTIAAWVDNLSFNKWWLNPLCSSL